MGEILIGVGGGILLTSGISFAFRVTDPWPSYRLSLVGVAIGLALMAVSFVVK